MAYRMCRVYLDLCILRMFKDTISLGAIQLTIAFRIKRLVEHVSKAQ